MGVVINRTGGDFKRDLPPEGRNPLRIVDVYGPFEKETRWGVKDTVRVVWACYDRKSGALLHGSYTKDGREMKGWPLTVSQDYTAVISEGSSLGKLLIELTGDCPSKREVESGEVDVEALLMGLSCEGKIVHSEDGRFANLEWVELLPEDSDLDLAPPADGRKVETGYTRIIHRDKRPGESAPPAREQRRASRTEERPARRESAEERPRRREEERRSEPPRGRQAHDSFDDFAPNFEDDDIPF